MPVCAVCGHDTPDPEARFCAACGRPLAAGEAEVTSVLGLSSSSEAEDAADTGSAETSGEHGLTELLAPGTALLVVKRGPSSGARFLLDADLTTAGRHPDSDIFLDDITVSRRHAEFHRDDQGFVVRDVGSLNGTYVNRARVDEVRLVNADEVQIGKYRLVFLAAVAPEGAA